MQHYIGLGLCLIVYLYSLYLLSKESRCDAKTGLALCFCVIVGIFIGKFGSDFMFPYFFTQSLSDKKEKKVYTALNILIIICAILYNGITWWMVLTCIALLFFRFCFGSGDIKCLIAISILFRQNTFADSIFLLLLFVLLSEIAFLVTRAIKRVPKKERTAFFPAMFFGYCMMLVIV